MQRLLLISISVCLLALPCAARSFAAQEPVTMVYVSYMADIEGGAGYPALMTLIRELRAAGTRVVLFHGGNALGPSALSSFDNGAHIIGILNQLQPDVLGLGCRDFMYKEDELLLRTDEAAFPIVCSNIYDPISLEPPGDSKRGHILQLPAPIGFLALVSPEMQTTYIQSRLVTTGGMELLPDFCDGLRRDGARFLVATADFSPENVQEALGESGLDLLFLSGMPETGLTMYGGRGVATHSGNGDDVLLVRLEPNSGGGLTISGHELRHLKDYAPDPAMEALIARYAKLFANLARIKAGTSLTALDTRTNVLRGGENAMGNLVADAMRDYYGSDISLLNSGGLLGNREYAAGTVLMRGDLKREMPMHAMSCLINVRGAIIRAALEHGVSQVELASGRFLQVSGLEYRYNPAAAPGSRVLSVSIGGKALELDKIYSVSLPEYINTYGDGFYMFPGECAYKAPRPQQEILEIALVYLALHNPVSPRLEGRVKAVMTGE